jgi:DNA (cytosine-5)-methyltransferase 1
MLKVGSDFSGVGAFNQALKRLGVEYKEVFACDMDKFARETFIHNYGEPEYYPTNVYDREIPSESLDVYMTSPPCQAFSLAGKRLGKEDKRGILFFNSHEFIQVNKPRFFIFENVKGLLSDDGGRTFQEWVNMLGGKSVNGVPVLFPYDDSVPYHLYWKVLNAKHHGVPQNRERVFLIGIRDDADNRFQFPREEHLTKRLKDVLEEEVFEKYYLSEKMVNYISHDRNGNYKLVVNRDIANAMTCSMKNQQRSFQDNYIQIKSATSKGYEEAREDIWIADYRNDEGLRIRKDNISPCMAARKHSETDISTMSPIIGYYNEKLNQGVIQKTTYGKHQQDCFYDSNGIMGTIPAGTHGSTPHLTKTLMPCGTKIRRLTPRECFRLMDFPDTFTWPVSDSQAYKQAGNSIVVNVLYKILKNLPL